MTQSQYALAADMQLVGVTPAAAVRFGAAAITANLKAASSIADTYLPSQFTLPLATSPHGWDMSLTLAVCSIAAYLLYSQFGFNPATSQADQLIVTRYQSALKWLEQIRDEEIFPQWVDSSGTDPVTAEAGPYIISDPPVGFTSRGVMNPDCDTWTW